LTGAAGLGYLELRVSIEIKEARRVFRRDGRWNTFCLPLLTAQRRNFKVLKRVPHTKTPPFRVNCELLIAMAGTNALSLDLSVYLVTDSSLVPAGKTLASVVDEALEGGATAVQLREKHLETRPFIDLAREIQTLCRAKSVPLLVNDRLDIALAIDADGVHIGQSDADLALARKMLGPNKIIGVTAESPAQAREALLGGADYLGTAGIFATKTKSYPEGRGSLGIPGLVGILSELRKLETEQKRPPIPVVAIGGIGRDNVVEVLNGAKLPAEGGLPARALAGIAVVSAIVAQADAKKATEDLAARIKPFVAAPVPSLALKRSPKEQAFLQSVIEVFNAVKAKKPLVHSITNFVVMNPNANVLLAIGASPIMAHSISEVADVVAFSSALVLNIGTLAEDTVPSFMAAGKKVSISPAQRVFAFLIKHASQANQVDIPVVFDPVGAGATPYRQSTARSLVTDLKLSIIKGNAAEISFLAASGQGPAQRGVDSEGEVTRPEATVKALARSSGAVIAMTGPVDFLSSPSGSEVVKLANGNEWLGRVTGTGCDTAALCGAFAGAAKGIATGPFDPILVAAAGAILVMGIAAELAVELGVRGPASFEVALFDELFGLTAGTLEKMAKIEIVQGDLGDPRD